LLDATPDRFAALMDFYDPNGPHDLRLCELCISKREDGYFLIATRS
jgi:hypothetical protein